MTISQELYTLRGHGCNPDWWDKEKTIQGKTYDAPYDEYFNELAVKAGAELDEVKRNAMLKEEGIYVIDEAVNLPMGTPYLLCCWWPRVKNYLREFVCRRCRHTWKDEKVASEEREQKNLK